VDEHANELDIAARFRKHDKPRGEKLSGAQRKKDTRERIKNKKGVWVLKNGWQPHPRVLRGRQSAQA